MILSIKNSIDAKDLLDQVLMKSAEIHRGRVQIMVAGGGQGYAGEIVERTVNWLVLKSDTGSSLVGGAKKGESIFSYVYIRVDQVVSVGFELVAKKA